METISLQNTLPNVFAQRNDVDSDVWLQNLTFEKGYLSEEQVSRLLGLQGNEYLSFAQTVTDKGFMTIADIENALSDYQKAYGFTATDIDALKSGDSDRIVPLYIPLGKDRMTYEISAGPEVKLINHTHLKTYKYPPE